MGILGVIGTAVGTYFGMPEVGAAVGGALDSATSGHGGGGSGNAANSGASPAAVADPFSSQRGQYQNPLSQLVLQQQAPFQNLLGQQAGIAGMDQLDPNASNVQRGILNAGPGSAQLQLQSMMAPGASFNSSDPSYKFRFDQGMQAVQRSGAARGLDGSGNILTALTDYGQGSASQEFQAQFQRLGALSSLQQSQQQQQFGQATAMNSQLMAALGQRFGQLGSVYTSGQNEYQNDFARLAQLSGANSGQPGQAGQLLAQQQAGSAAYTQQLGSQLGQLAQNWFGSGNSNGGQTFFGSGSSSPSVGPVTFDPSVNTSLGDWTPDSFGVGP